MQNVYILDRQDFELGQKTISQMQEEFPSSKIHYRSMDITKEEEIKKCLQDIKDIDVLVNGAGICDDTHVDQEIAINLVGLDEDNEQFSSKSTFRQDLSRQPSWLLITWTKERMEEVEL